MSTGYACNEKNTHFDRVRLTSTTQGAMHERKHAHPVPILKFRDIEQLLFGGRRADETDDESDCEDSEAEDVDDEAGRDDDEVAALPSPTFDVDEGLFELDINSATLRDILASTAVEGSQSSVAVKKETLAKASKSGKGSFKVTSWA